MFSKPRKMPVGMSKMSPSSRVTSPAVPHDLRWMTAALEPSLVLLLFYSAFADIWLSPITYIVITLVMVFKGYVSRRRVVVV